MRPRDPREPGRTASTLELFFDLVFVVAVSNAAVQLHHALSREPRRDGLTSYAMVFFGSGGLDELHLVRHVLRHRRLALPLLTIVQMSGVLVPLGVEPAFTDHDYTLLILAYVVMRVAMVAQWLRASCPPGAAADQDLAGGIALLQVCWLLLLALPEVPGRIAFIVLVGAELAIPVIAERHGTTPWHPHHITERYGLFTLILLGESLLASANAVIEALHDEAALGPLISIAVVAVVVTAALWWIYFWPPHHTAIRDLHSSLRYGYVHYFVFAAAGAFSAGIEVEIDVLTGHSQLGDVAASFTVTVPIAIFVLGIWWIAIRDNADRVVNVALPLGAVLVLFDPIIPIPITLTAVIMVLMVVVLVLHPPVTAHSAAEDQPAS
jgi:low temperature requirement protein LtrA